MVATEGRNMEWETTKLSLDDENEREFFSTARNFFQENFSDGEATEDNPWVDCLFPHPSEPTLALPPKKIRFHGATNLIYQRAYEEYAQVSTAHLSNAEWTALRIRRDQELQVLQNRQNGQDAALFRPVEDIDLSLFDREILLYEEGVAANSGQATSTRYRRAARQLPVSAHAQRERLNHWSLSLLVSPLRRVRQPLRSFSRRSTATSGPTETVSWREIDEGSSSEEENDEELPVTLFGQDDGSSTEEENDEEISVTLWNDYLRNNTVGGENEHASGYWSSGTAFESDSDSVSVSSQGSYCRRLVRLSSLPESHASSLPGQSMSSSFISVGPSDSSAVSFCSQGDYCRELLSLASLPESHASTLPVQSISSTYISVGRSDSSSNTRGSLFPEDPFTAFNS
eukprot:scaffold993_cov110-Cylindrotheca_fusiformis.AAC.5